MNFFKKIIQDSKFFFSIIILSFITLNVIFYYLFIHLYPNFVDVNKNLVISELTHSYADILQHLLKEKKYYSLFFDFEVPFYVGRLPFIPFLLFFIIKFLTQKYLFILIIKNLILFIPLLYLLKKIIKNNFDILCVLFLIFFIPYNLQILLMIVPEEGYIIYFLLIIFILFISDIKNRINIISIFLFFLFFIKGSLCFFIYSICLYFLFLEKEKKPILVISLCYFIWASYAYVKTDRIISPISLVSIGGVTLASANNQNFNKIYPLITPDYLYDEVLDDHRHVYKNFKSEFEFDDYFKKYNMNYILKNKKEFSLSFLKKLNVIIFNIKKDAKYPEDKSYDKIRYSNIINLCFLYFAIFIFLKKIINRDLNRSEKFFLIFVPSYFFPFMVGFVYTRHVVPLYLISIIYVYLEFFKLKFKYISNQFQ